VGSTLVRVKLQAVVGTPISSTWNTSLSRYLGGISLAIGCAEPIEKFLTSSGLSKFIVEAKLIIEKKRYSEKGETRREEVATWLMYHPTNKAHLSR